MQKPSNFSLTALFQTASIAVQIDKKRSLTHGRFHQKHQMALIPWVNPICLWLSKHLKGRLGPVFVA